MRIWGGPDAFLLDGLADPAFAIAFTKTLFEMPATLRGEAGRAAFTSLIRTYFKRGGMQVQTNVLDPKELIRARDNPALHPNLLVRVSGYSVYFNDLTPVMKEEIIRRSTHFV